MTREQIYNICLDKLQYSHNLLLELPTGFGKSKLAIDIINHLINEAKWPKDKTPTILLLVAKRVHKQTWNEEFQKWGGIHAQVIAECYESLHKHAKESFDFILLDEVHHVGSEARMRHLNMVNTSYMIGLSATIPRPVKQYFKFRYHTQIVSCNLTEAIQSDILPEPQVLLFPLLLDNRQPTETWEYHTDAKGPVIHAEYKDIRKYKFNKNVHSIVSMTQKQKLMEFDNLIDFFKNRAMAGNVAAKRSWLFQAGKRLEFLADIKMPIIKDILHHLKNHRTITFCKTIDQTEKAGRNCIHSKNSFGPKLYEMFNKKEINHITAVNILNENANLVDCKYAIFCNLSSSEVMVPQRIGRSLRHRSPVIIIPYYQNTREEELVAKMVEGFNKDCIKTIHSIQEI